jgi:RNA polymerase sigma factor (sigma-70 family)
MATVEAPRAVVDIDDLYRALSKRLERIVRFGVRAPDPVIEDACQFAWSRLVHHGDRVQRDTALSWLVKTAVHEAFKLMRRGARDVSLEREIEDREDIGGAARGPGPAELLEQHEQFAAIGVLPVRQQRLLWLGGLGLSYEEMALHEACTTRTVERQLIRARRSLRAASLE